MDRVRKAGRWALNLPEPEAKPRMAAPGIRMQFLLGREWAFICQKAGLETALPLPPLVETNEFYDILAIDDTIYYNPQVVSKLDNEQLRQLFAPAALMLAEGQSLKTAGDPDDPITLAMARDDAVYTPPFYEFETDPATTKAHLRHYDMKVIDLKLAMPEVLARALDLAEETRPGRFRKTPSNLIHLPTPEERANDVVAPLLQHRRTGRVLY